MAHDEHSFAPDEQAQAEILDRLIDERLRAQPFLPPDRRETADSLLIRELSRFYQPQAEEIQAHLHRARERVEQRSAPSFAPRPPQLTPLTRLRSLRGGRNHMKTPRSLWDQAQGPCSGWQPGGQHDAGPVWRQHNGAPHPVGLDADARRNTTPNKARPDDDACECAWHPGAGHHPHARRQQRLGDYRAEPHSAHH